jgi:CubicO group peptidase (beta-lactamase class C family)
MKLAHLALLAAALLLATPLTAQSKVSLAFRDSLPAWLAAAHVPGIAVAVLEHGKVMSTIAVGELRPGLPMTPRALFNVASLTTRIVLSHQTGFPNWRRKLPSKKLGCLFDPGTTFGYSGEGFEYLRHALDHHFNTTLPHLADSILYKPLGMTETTYGWNPSMDTARFAIGHDTAGVAINEGMRTTDRPSAADWLVATIGDYSKFAAFVLQGAGQ